MSLSEPDSRSREQGDATLEEADVHFLLSNDRRRNVLDLLEGDRQKSVRALAEEIAVLESGESPPPSELRQSVYVSLTQTHLPKMDELGVLAFDESENTVALGDQIDDVRVYLDVVPEHEVSWAEYYFALAGIGVVVVGGATLGVPGFALLSPAVWGLAFLATIAVSAAYQSWEQGSPWIDAFRNLIE